MTTTLAAPRVAVHVPAALGALVVLLQVAYPLTDGGVRDVLTVMTVVVFAAASVSHAAVHRGVGWALGYVAIVLPATFAAEAVGVATGFPFGEYAYAGSLGPALLGVPVVVPLAWLMFAYPCLLVGRALAGNVLGAVAVGAWALASWDLFLDPQMVTAGHWVWQDVGASLPGSPDVPLSNLFGWLLVATLLMSLLQALPWRDTDDRVPGALFLWTYVSYVLAFAVFFGRPGVALLGGIAMGVVAVPYARLWSTTARCG